MLKPDSRPRAPQGRLLRVRSAGVPVTVTVTVSFNSRFEVLLSSFKFKFTCTVLTSPRGCSHWRLARDLAEAMGFSMSDATGPGRSESESNAPSSSHQGRNLERRDAGAGLDRDRGIRVAEFNTGGTVFNP